MTDHLTALQASKRKATRQRDNWKARAERYREALEILRDELSRVRDVVGEVDAGIIDGVLARTVLREVAMSEAHP